MALRATIHIRGIVQGVGFRPFIYRKATEKRLKGFVRNLGDGTVQIVVEGEPKSAEEFVNDIKNERTDLARIDDLDVLRTPATDEFESFVIKDSSSQGTNAGSIVPFDVSICERCLTDMRDPANRRHDYFFTTCTQCGPRYSLTLSVPFDRERTTMAPFIMCKECEHEYTDPLDRRFHAQTIACPSCGPRLFLTDQRGFEVPSSDPAREAGGIIAEGAIVAIKGNGGFHIAASATLDRPLNRLREAKHRAQKPFAVMSPTLDAARTFSETDDSEEKLLVSPRKPIVLLRKSRHYILSTLVSPGIHNTGVMLPYTGLHHLLFEHTGEPAFVMTSGNLPNEPIVTRNDEALLRLGKTVDYFLMHDREIAQRCDDSVIRVNNGQTAFIRRSRGYAPAPIILAKKSKFPTLALGAEENVTCCIILENRAFMSQHIGDIENLETYDFLRDAVMHLLRLTKVNVERVACDLHPRFLTTKLAHRLGEELKSPVIPVQHHNAHILSLMAEKGLAESVGIACDGAGYGPDGSTWGGEILHCMREAFTRIGHLQEHRLLGGDLAAVYPLRMSLSILGDSVAVTDWLRQNSKQFPHGMAEVELVIKQLNNVRSPMTTSCGRVLDAVSALLGLCTHRTYEGEPAMKLESAALGGEDVLKLSPRIHANVLDTAFLLQRIFESKGLLPVSDLAYSAEEYLAKGLAYMAIEAAQHLGIRDVCFSGGVAYNNHMTATIKTELEAQHVYLIVHELVPPGDGSISLGQALAAACA